MHPKCLCNACALLSSCFSCIAYEFIVQKYLFRFIICTELRFHATTNRKKCNPFFLNWSGIHLKSLFLDTACFCLSLSMQNYASHFICFWHPHTNTYMFVHFAYVKPKKTDFFRAPTNSANMLSAQDVCKNGKLRSFYLNWNLSELRLQIPYSKARCLWNANQWNDSSRREKGCFKKIIRNEQHYEIKRPFDSTRLNDWNFFSINTSNYYVKHWTFWTNSKLDDANCFHGWVHYYDPNTVRTRFFNAIIAPKTVNIMIMVTDACMYSTVSSFSAVLLKW